jgi:hypothetical protein
MSRALPSRPLPSRALPGRALQIIHDYSLPMCKPNWRKSKPIITTYRLYLHVKYVMCTDPTLFSIKRLHSIILTNIMKTEWYQVYTYIKIFGLDRRIVDYSEHMIKADGIEDAIYHYRWR